MNYCYVIVLCPNAINEKGKHWYNPNCWYAIGVFDDKEIAEEIITKENITENYKICQVKSNISENLDDESKQHIIQNSNSELVIYCLLRYNTGHYLEMDVLYVSDDLDECLDMSKKDHDIWKDNCFCKFSYYWVRFTLNNIDHNAFQNQVNIRANTDEATENYDH